MIGVLFIWRWSDTSAVVQPEPKPSLTFEEVCRDSLQAGWKVKHQPDLPGPYSHQVTSFLYYHPEAGGVCTVRLRDRAGATFWEEKTRPGVSFLAVTVETTNGQSTEGLLVRGE
jgi:hypothetical protein